jgi:hypothetical protein
VSVSTGTAEAIIHIVGYAFARVIVDRAIVHDQAYTGEDCERHRRELEKEYRRGAAPVTRARS